jgi:hypothetical protein
LLDARQQAIDTLNHAIENWDDDRYDVGAGTFGDSAMWYLKCKGLTIVKEKNSDDN